ncbi:hypothetical protein [Mucilaginibacter arboris]|uniref:HEPN domain-containing protein n=1 Tax=Mucilaginibacter arboris TaxID=2682090 RepID=A0A7K1SXR2_9SPHI|nr:hypothetical protein [Mucilaginibacter arboris]MVN22114.1 hypothetical protein [Mucilaginibacter arboris]
MNANISDDEALFLNAELFRDAAQVIFLRARATNVHPVAALKFFNVGIMNEAIAIELYLKCLIYMNSNTHYGKHEYPKLFKRLSEEHQHKVTLYYEQFLNENPIIPIIKKDHPTIDFSLPAILNDCKDAFQKHRYEHEYGSSNYTLSDFARALHKLILELKTHFSKILSPETCTVTPDAVFLRHLANGQLVVSDLTETAPIFYNAMCFSYTSDLLLGRQKFSDSPDEVKWHLCLPVICNHAFAIELFLKMIITLEGNGPGLGHDLEFLFNLLNENTRLKITEYYDELIKANPRTLKIGSTTSIPLSDYKLPTVLHAARGSVVSYRYVHENRMQIYALLDFLFAIKRILWEMKHDLPGFLGFNAIEFYPHAAIIK